MRLIDCKMGKTYKIIGIDEALAPKLKRRLFDLGLLSGHSIKVVRKSLLSKAYLIEVRGYTLSLRNTIVRAILVA